MTTTPLDLRSKAIIRPYKVPANKATVAGFPVKLSGADDAVEKIGAVGDNAIGISLDTGAPGDTVRVALWGKGVVPALVGTGGATRGAPAKYASDGLTDATVGGGTTKLTVCGQFLENGVAGDLVGLNLAGFSFTVGS